MKKKRSEEKGDERISGKKLRFKKESSNGGATAADDAELEEFLAIVKRLQAGLNRFQKNGAGDFAGKSAVVTPPAMDSGSWNLGFELDDFNQLQDDKLKTSKGDTSHDDGVVGFDLNADPASDQTSD